MKQQQKKLTENLHIVHLYIPNNNNNNLWIWINQNHFHFSILSSISFHHLIIQFIGIPKMSKNNTANCYITWININLTTFNWMNELLLLSCHFQFCCFNHNILWLISFFYSIIFFSLSATMNNGCFVVNSQNAIIQYDLNDRMIVVSFFEKFIFFQKKISSLSKWFSLNVDIVIWWQKMIFLKIKIAWALESFFVFKEENVFFNIHFHFIIYLTQLYSFIAMMMMIEKFPFYFV